MDPVKQRAFFDELVKIGEPIVADDDEFGARLPTKVKQDVQGTGAGMGAGMGAGVAATSAGGLVGQLGAGALGKSLQKDIGKSGYRLTAGEAEGLRRAMGAEAPVHILGERGVESAVHIPKGGSLPKPLRKVEEGMYPGVPKKVAREGLRTGMSIAPEYAGAPFAAHEMGHGRLRQGLLGKGISALRMPASVAGSIAAPMMATYADPDSTASKLAPVVGAAGVAPLLIDEGYASLKGYKTMKGLGSYTPAALKAARRQLGKAWGTYALAAGIPAIATPLAIRYAKKWKKRKLEREAEEGKK